MDTGIRHLGLIGYSAVLIVFLRNVFAMPISLALALHEGWRGSRRKAIAFHALRGVFGFGAGTLFFHALSILPLVEAMAIGFCAPVMIPWAARVLVGERVRGEYIVAGLIGFAGVSLTAYGVLQEREGLEYGPKAVEGVLSALASAALYAVSVTMVRMRVGRESPREIALHQTFWPILFAAPFAFGDALEVRGEHLPVFVFVGLVGVALAQAMAYAFSHAPPQRLAPLEYTALFWGGVLGWLAFGEAPRLWSLVGAAVIVLGAVYAARLARQDARQARPSVAFAQRPDADP
jgi:S-adenosylmethionine uptake transporter